MANNILLNKPATANSFVMPYASSKIVDGAITPFNRWLCNTLPGWITIDAGAAFWVNRWIMKLMGNAGWASNYNMPAYTLQTSLDNNNWTTIDSVSGNTANSTDRTFATISARYFRISVPSGIAINTNLASIMEFEVYDAPAPNGLSSLTVSSGTLTPTFNNQTTNYAVSVANTVESITVTPTATLPAATITVDGTTVVSGTASQAINLLAGQTKPISIVVTNNGSSKTYTVQATRAGQTSANLTSITLKAGKTTPQLAPSFLPTVLSYTTTTTATPVTITVAKEDSNASLYVTCNNVEVTSSDLIYSVNVNTGSNTVVIKVTSTSGIINNYTIVISKS